LYGVGWLHVGDQWATLQNAYLQTLVESGLIGASVLATALVVASRGVYRNYREAKRRQLPKELLYLNLAFLVPVLAHGAAESSLFIGASLDSLFLGMGIGLVDRMLPLVSTTGPSTPRRGRAAPVRTIGITSASLSGWRRPVVPALPSPQSAGVVTASPPPPEDAQVKTHANSARNP
jgi:hypothetical protein